MLFFYLKFHGCITFHNFVIFSTGYLEEKLVSFSFDIPIFPKLQRKENNLKNYCTAVRLEGEARIFMDTKINVNMFFMKLKN